MSDLPLPEPAQDKVLDIQHDTDPADDHGLARRIPHLGHALLFFSIIFTAIVVAGIIAVLAFHISSEEAAAQHPLVDILIELCAYIATLAASVPLFPLLWHKSFLEGIHWTWRAARLHWWKLVLLGLVCSVLAQIVDSLFKMPADTDLLRFFRSPLTAWILVICGSAVIPLMEEIGFRGFLLPGLATAYDWVSLERTPAGLVRWQQTTSHTRSGWVFGAVVSSFAFTALHGKQLHWAHGPLATLFVLGLILAAVRIRFRSVAASTLVHLAYDGLIFVELIVSTGGFRHLEKLK